MGKNLELDPFIGVSVETTQAKLQRISTEFNALSDSRRQEVRRGLRERKLISISQDPYASDATREISRAAVSLRTPELVGTVAGDNLIEVARTAADVTMLIMDTLVTTIANPNIGLLRKQNPHKNGCSVWHILNIEKTREFFKRRNLRLEAI